VILKILGLVAVLFLIYFFFFKMARTNGEAPLRKPKKPKKLQGETMLECAKCSTFVSDKDAIIKEGQFFCSRECANV